MPYLQSEDEYHIKAYQEVGTQDIPLKSKS